MQSFLFLDSIFVAAAVVTVDSVANMQYFVCVHGLHTLELTGQETVVQMKAHGASVEGIALKDQVVLLAGTLMEEAATLGQCGVEALTTL
ncbi:hypothetical protein CB1_002081006 [Camelus ferus]|nr:hypothetical protein CB1_002081006 [Camelus ferus]